MLKKFFMVIGFISLVAVSGCIDDVNNILGMNVHKTEAPPDILAIENVNIFPNPPISAGSQFTLSFEVANKDKFEDATNVKIQGYDWGTCTPENPPERNKIVESPDYSHTIYPGGVELIEWNFRAPGNDLLGNMNGICPLRFKAQYDFSAKTVASVTVVSEERLLEAARSGEAISVTPTMTQARGPIKIDIEFGMRQPIRSGSTVQIMIRVKDKGTGLYSEVPAGKLKITSNLNLVCDDTKFGKNIKMIRRESPPYRCVFTAPSVTDMKTFYIKAELPYTYELYGKKDVVIKPVLGASGS